MSSGGPCRAVVWSVIAWAPPVRGRRSRDAPPASRSTYDRAPRGVVVGRGAAQVTVVEEAELDGGLLVVPHRLQRRRRRRAPWRYARASRRAPRSTSHGMSLAGSSPRWAASSRAASEQPPLATGAPRRRRRRGDERRQPSRAGRRRRSPRARRASRRSRARGPARRGRTRRAARGTARRLRRLATAMPTPMPMNEVNSGWANGLTRQRRTKVAGQRLDAAGARAVGAVVGRGEVEDVLDEREADADHAGVDEAVEDPVELVAAPPEQQQQERAPWSPPRSPARRRSG